MNRVVSKELLRFLTPKVLKEFESGSLKFQDKIICKCPDCGREFSTTISNLKRRCYCPKCHRSKSLLERQKKELTDSQLRLLSDAEDLSAVLSGPRTAKAKFICPIHGVYKQRVDLHLKGRGCPICGPKKAHSSNRQDSYEHVKEIFKRQKVTLLTPFSSDFFRFSGGKSNFFEVRCDICGRILQVPLL